MTIDRRDFLVSGSAAAVGAMLPGTAVAQTVEEAARFEAEFEQVLATLRKAFAERGYEEIAPLPIVTGDLAYNGGLRPNVDAMRIRPQTLMIQQSARLDDIEERDRPDLLPMFNVFLAMLPEGSTDEQQIALAHALLTGTFGLDPDRIAFASVPEVEKMRQPLARVGWDLDNKVHIRDPEESRRSRDGSGYFWPIPDGPVVLTSMGVYYRLTVDGESSFSTYPPPREWSEIGEISIGEVMTQALVFGVERLTLAASGRYPQWHHRLDQLRNAVKASGTETLPALDNFAQ